jgi:transmembrane sensor
MDERPNRSNSARRKLSEQAARWYLDQREGMTESAQRAFLKWLRQSPEHVGEYAAIARLHGDLRAVAALDTLTIGQLREMASGEPAVVALPGVHVRRPASARSRHRGAARPRRRLMGWATGCTATIVLGTIALLGASHAGPPAAVFSAGADQGRSFELADGTLIQLGRDSAIAVRFDANQRQIDLLHGSALFDVGKDPARPLRVQLGSNVLRDIGTVFEAQRTPDGATVTVLSGRIHVLAPRHPWLDTLAQRLGGATPPGTLVADLGAGQQVSLDDGGRLAALAPHADLTQATAWLPGEIRFHDRPLSEVARRFNAYTRTPLRIEDPAIAQMRISGLFHAHDVSAFAAYLASLPGVRVHREAGCIRVWASAASPAAPRRAL